MISGIVFHMKNTKLLSLFSALALLLLLFLGSPARAATPPTDKNINFTCKDYSIANGKGPTTLCCTTDQAPVNSKTEFGCETGSVCIGAGPVIGNCNLNNPPPECFPRGTGICVNNAAAQGLCDFLGYLRGRFGKILAAIMVVVLGFGFFLGKISWGLILGTVVGIVAIFSSLHIVSLLSGQSTEQCQGMN